MLADVPLDQLTSDELHARNAWAQVYLVLGEEPEPSPGAPPPALVVERRDHLRRLETAGRLYASGPMEGVAGDAIRELTIVAAASLEDATRIAMDDPFHREGYVTNTVRPHIMNEGVACYVARAMSRRTLVGGGGTDSSPGRPGPAGTAAARDDEGRAVELFLIFLDPTDKPRAEAAERADHAHFRWLRENEMAARLMSCGPVGAVAELGPGVWSGGLAVVATSRAEAERLARDEPSGQAGYRTLSVRGWTVHQGLAAPIASVLRTLNDLPS